METPYEFILKKLSGTPEENQKAVETILRLKDEFLMYESHLIKHIYATGMKDAGYNNDDINIKVEEFYNDNFSNQ